MRSPSSGDVGAQSGALEMACCEQRSMEDREPEKKKPRLNGDNSEPQKENQDLKDNSDSSIKEEEVVDSEDGHDREMEVDSDEDCYSEANMKVLKRVAEQFKASEGFDVDDFPPKLRILGLIAVAPLSHPNKSEQLRQLSKLAIEKYNEENDAKYQFVRVMKATAQFCGGMLYYITFEAKDADGDAETFQAQTYRGIPDRDGTPHLEVHFCRVNPTK